MPDELIHSLKDTHMDMTPIVKGNIRNEFVVVLDRGGVAPDVHYHEPTRTAMERRAERLCRLHMRGYMQTDENIITVQSAGY